MRQDRAARQRRSSTPKPPESRQRRSANFISFLGPAGSATDVYVGRYLHVLGRGASGLLFRGRRALLDLETLRPYGKLSFVLSAAVVVS